MRKRWPMYPILSVSHIGELGLLQPIQPQLGQGDYVDCYTRICHYNIVLTEKDTGFGARGPFEKFCLDSVAFSESNEA